MNLNGTRTNAEKFGVFFGAKHVFTLIYTHKVRNTGRVEVLSVFFQAAIRLRGILLVVSNEPKNYNQTKQNILFFQRFFM